jgi:MurNAc alpha-1-phosphate uridylyltransferase
MLPLAILVGGFASRLGFLTKDLPKCLMEINGRAFIDWQLDLLIENGYSDFIFCTSYKSAKVQDYLGDGLNRGVSFRYSLDGEIQLGTGGALRNALPLLGHEFGVIYGDSYLPMDYAKVESHFLLSPHQGMMTIYRNSDKLDSSNVQFEDGKLLRYQKGRNDGTMQHIDYGLTYFRSFPFFDFAPKTPFDLSDLCYALAEEGELEGFEVFKRFYEIGSVSGIEEFSNYLRKVSE